MVQVTWVKLVTKMTLTASKSKDQTKDSAVTYFSFRAYALVYHDSSLTCMGYLLNNFEKKTAHSLTKDTFISLMDGRLNEVIGVGLLRGTCGLLDTADSVGRDLGDALLACEYHAN